MTDQYAELDAALEQVFDAARAHLAAVKAAQGRVDDDAGQVESVGEAVLELLQAGDGSLSSLDVPELEPFDGLLTVSEVPKPLDLEAYDESDGTGPFTPGEDDVLV